MTDKFSNGLGVKLDGLLIEECFRFYRIGCYAEYPEAATALPGSRSGALFQQAVE
ncbi:hypothetical protein [Aureliella helgolandensis]|uniref:hypothetical protein n=1 Tax=Aureliella helgolandensis TaxID=2527968 RepID=UPI0018D0661A|nr:hypothetical protein [Aureliella helgolandensis]